MYLSLIPNSVVTAADLRGPCAPIPQKQLCGGICFTACGAFPTTLSGARASEFTAIYGMWLGEEAWARVAQQPERDGGERITFTTNTSCGDMLVQ